MKKQLLYFISGAVFLAVFFPRYESLTNTYQTSLWTYDQSGKRFTLMKVPPEFCCRFGGQLSTFELVYWARLRLGLFSPAITIDIQPNNRIFQIRGELVYVIINIGCGGAIGFTLFSLLQRKLLRRKLKFIEKKRKANAAPSRVED